MILLTALLCVLLVAGGASRADVLGQAVVRGTAWSALVCVIAFVPRPALRQYRPVLALMVGALALILLQLVPLPSAWWLALPGRKSFEQAAVAMGTVQPWRPLAIVPDAAWNAAASLVVPFAVLILTAALRPRERIWLPAILLGLIVVSALLGLLQFSGAALGNPFINDSPGQVSGSLANRNHFALFTAIGCLLAPIWALPEARATRWRGPVGIGLTLLFALVILASGSRAGILLGTMALALGMLFARRGLRRAPRWVLPLVAALLAVILAAFVFISIEVGRAPSIERMSAEAGEDLRFRALPTVLTMTRTYFPAGIGFGGFDPLFRMHEPYALLKPTYFNHAHDDLLEVVLEGGVGALLLLISGIGWWLRASIGAWRGGATLARLGSAIILLILVSSAVDYPVRTPMMTAVLVIAAMWLAADAPGRRSQPLPADGRQL